MERFLRPDAPTVVSVYAPITFSPAGVLLFKQRSDGEGKKSCMSQKRGFLAAWPLFDFKLEGACILLETTWLFQSSLNLMSIPSHHLRLCVVSPLKASRTWWPQAACSAVILGVSCWRGLSSADTPSKLTAAPLLCVTCSSTEVRGERLLLGLFFCLPWASTLTFTPFFPLHVRWHHVVQARRAANKVGSQRPH